MGIGDNVRGTAENTLRDLAGLSEPTDDAHVPEPGTPGEEIKVHSSISEGSNATDPSAGATHRTDEPVRAPDHGTAGNIVPGDRDGDPAVIGAAEAAGEETVSSFPRDVPGPGGLPDPDPGGPRADPSEGDGDPTASMGRD